jgi:hypothetical protein
MYFKFVTFTISSIICYKACSWYLWWLKNTSSCKIFIIYVMEFTMFYTYVQLERECVGLCEVIWKCFKSPSWLYIKDLNEKTYFNHKYKADISNIPKFISVSEIKYNIGCDLSQCKLLNTLLTM